MKKIYLGDSVYAEYVGFSIKLTTENGRPNDPSNTIYLDPDVIEQLMLYIKLKRYRSAVEKQITQEG